VQAHTSMAVSSCPLLLHGERAAQEICVCNLPPTVVFWLAASRLMGRKQFSS